jgi:hypothetical protein
MVSIILKITYLSSSSSCWINRTCSVVVLSSTVTSLGQYEILACYETNGLTDEHKAAIKEFWKKSLNFFLVSVKLKKILEDGLLLMISDTPK